MNPHFTNEATYEILTGNATNFDDVNYSVYTKYYKNLYDRIPNLNYNFDSQYSKDNLYKYMMDNSPDAPNITDDYKLDLDTSTIRKRIMREDVAHDSYDYDINTEIDTPEPEYNILQETQKLRNALNVESRRQRIMMQTYKADTPVYETDGTMTNRQLHNVELENKRRREKILQKNNTETLTSSALRAFITQSRMTPTEKHDIQVNLTPTQMQNIKSNFNNKRTNDTNSVVYDNLDYKSTAEKQSFKTYAPERGPVNRSHFTNATPLGISHEINNVTTNPLQKPINKKLYEFMKNVDITSTNRQKTNNMNSGNSNLPRNEKLYNFIKSENFTNNIKGYNMNIKQKERLLNPDVTINGYEFIKNINSNKSKIPNIKNLYRKDANSFEILLNDDKIININTKNMYTKNNIDQIMESIDPQYVFDGMTNFDKSYNAPVVGYNINSNTVYEKPLYSVKEHTMSNASSKVLLNTAKNSDFNIENSHYEIMQNDGIGKSLMSNKPYMQSQTTKMMHMTNYVDNDSVEMINKRR